MQGFILYTFPLLSFGTHYATCSLLFGIQFKVPSYYVHALVTTPSHQYMLHFIHAYSSNSVLLFPSGICQLTLDSNFLYMCWIPHMSSLLYLVTFPYHLTDHSHSSSTPIFLIGSFDYRVSSFELYIFVIGCIVSPLLILVPPLVNLHILSHVILSLYLAVWSVIKSVHNQTTTCQHVLSVLHSFYT